MPEPLQLKDHGNEARIVTVRMVWILFFVVIMMGALLVRYYNLQVTNYRDYATQSDDNRIHVQPIPPTRGLIYDRNGVLLAENRPSFTLTVIKERVQDLDQTLALLSEIIDIDDDDLERFNEGLAQRRRPFEAVSLRYNLTEEEIARIAVNEYRLPGVEVEAQLVRYYPYGDLFAHSVGYVGRINQREQEAFDEEEYANYRGTETIGKIGLEKQYEKRLLGQVGYQNVEINARGRVLRELDRTNPTPGQDLHLYLDSGVQKVASDLLGDRRGAVVAIEVKTGGVIALISKPGFDPNLFVTGISHKDFNALNGSLDKPLFDRSLQGQYAPGSTIKPMLGLAGLQSGAVDPGFTINDPGYYRLEGEEREFRDWKKGGHGRGVDLRYAIEESCNTFFYQLAYKMGIDVIHDFGAQFGLGHRTGIDIPSEKRGIWPSRAWKRESEGLPWFPGDTLNTGIGQGYVALTPVQLAVMTATLASRGQHLQPMLVQPEQREIAENYADRNRPVNLLGQVKASEAHWDYVLGAMEDVVQRGTARTAVRQTARNTTIKNYRQAGKTGTAQLVGIAQDDEEQTIIEDERLKNQALYIGFAPTDDPQIAVAVIIENGLHGSAAAPIAVQVFDAYFESEQRRAAQTTAERN